MLKIPSLFGEAGEHIHGQVAVGFVLTGIAAYRSVRFLVRYFQTHTLMPFAIYCVLFGDRRPDQIHAVLDGDQRP